MKYKLVVFDMDGTILNTLTDLLNAVNYALEKNNYPLRTIAELKNFVGNGIDKMLERSAPSGADLKKLKVDFTEFYSVHCGDNTAPYDGIVDAIKEIKNCGYKTAVVSNKDDYAVKVLVDDFFNGLFDISIGAREGLNKKPSADLVNIAFKELNTSCEQSVYVGDSDVDFLTSQNSKTDFIGVEWGFRDRELLESLGAKIVVSHPSEIIKYL
ncbi:MAG: HAD family hydrolase [Clostridia bacterium]|nr:HAD family hydrolase [Clostridia bacterium]